MMLDPRRALTFAVFADHLHFTRAAAALHLTQPALHMQVKQLEDEAGQKLYTRAGQRLILTQAGEAVAALGRRIAGDLDTVARGLHGSESPITLAAGEGTLLYLLPSTIRRFRKEHKGLLRIVTADRDASLRMVKEGRAHVAVTSVETVPADLRAMTLCDVPQMLAITRTHPLAKRRKIELAALADVDLIVPPFGSALRTALDAAVPNLRIAAEAQGWPLMLSCVAWRLGAAVVNAFCTPPKGVVLRPLVGLPARRYVCVWHPAMTNDTRVKHFVSVVSAASASGAGPSNRAR